MTRRLNWLAYQFREYDGYGRFSNRFISALLRQGAEVKPILSESVFSPRSTQRLMGIDWDDLTIQCLPVFYAVPVPGRCWLYSMTEGSELPDGWAAQIARIMPERILVPCEYNAKAFRDGMRAIGLDLPVHIVNGGTDPAEFDADGVSERFADDDDDRYTFVALGDRGARKGWAEVWEAFYRAFGTVNDTPDVKLIVKSRPVLENNLIDMIAEAENPDPRIEMWREDVDDMRDVWSRADCVAMPSRSEGFGMPHREAAMTGVPVITQKYGGIDDGFTEHWAIIVKDGKLEKIPESYEHIQGEWRKADVAELATAMKFCKENPRVAAQLGLSASQWLAENQTWDHSARELLELVKEHTHGADSNAQDGHAS